MKNPWTHLPNAAPYIIPEDEHIIGTFNAKQDGTDKEIMLSEIPSPYIGNPKAPVVFLNLNAAYDPKESQHHIIGLYREAAKKNLLHELEDYPCYVFNPALSGTPSGYKWFTKKFAPLMMASGINEHEFSRRVFIAEYFPYKSKKFGWKEKDLLYSQKYTFDLVERAVERGSLIVSMRSYKLWCEAVPSLQKYEQVFRLNSPQNVIISENNLGYEAFSKLVDKITYCTNP